MLFFVYKKLQDVAYSLNSNIKSKMLISSPSLAPKFRSSSSIPNFLSLFEEITRPYIVVTFLGILEMAKSGEIILKQDKNFGTILLERVD